MNAAIQWWREIIGAMLVDDVRAAIPPQGEAQVSESLLESAERVGVDRRPRDVMATLKRIGTPAVERRPTSLADRGRYAKRGYRAKAGR